MLKLAVEKGVKTWTEVLPMKEAGKAVQRVKVRPDCRSLLASAYTVVGQQACRRRHARAFQSDRALSVRYRHVLKMDL
jgi:hypothetical protein